MLIRRFLSSGCRMAGWTLLSCLVASPHLVHAQRSVPLVNRKSDEKPTHPMEVEVIEVHRLSAAPDEIHRKAGEFILMVDNETRNPNAVFVLLPANAKGEQAGKPLLQLGGPVPASQQNRSAGYRTLCTIDIQ